MYGNDLILGIEQRHRKWSDDQEVRMLGAAKEFFEDGNNKKYTE